MNDLKRVRGDLPSSSDDDESSSITVEEVAADWQHSTEEDEEESLTPILVAIDELVSNTDITHVFILLHELYDAHRQLGTVSHIQRIAIAAARSIDGWTFEQMPTTRTCFFCLSPSTFVIRTRHDVDVDYACQTCMLRFEFIRSLAAFENACVECACAPADQAFNYRRYLYATYVLVEDAFAMLREHQDASL
jgi:hypothetical protein